MPTSIDSVHSIGSGTSYAAPIVTGIAAQIMQSCPVTKTNKNSLKSYLVCGADNGSITQTTPSYGNLTDESGSGLVNAVKSFELAHSLDETYGVWTPGAIAPTPYYDEAEIELYEGERIRIALTFRKPENIAITSDYGNDIDIRLVTIQNNKKIVYLHKRNFEISNSRHADEKSTNWSHAMLSRDTKIAS